MLYNAATCYTRVPNNRWVWNNRNGSQLSGRLVWTYELFKVYGWVPGQKYPKTN